jgi:cbb3-type cytochrome oxidase subunit 3
MGRLIGPMFADSPLLALPILSLAIFLGVFLFVSFRTYRRSAAEYSDVAALPLADDDSVTQNEGDER